MNAGRKVLITGAGGYLGLNLAAAMAGDCELRLLVRREAPFRTLLQSLPGFRNRVEIFEADVRDTGAVQRACQGVAAVVHLAALTSDEQPGQHELLEVNILGTQAVLHAAQQAGVRRVIFPSTYHVYGRLRGLPAGPVREDSALDPVSVYAASKALGESMAKSSGVEEVVVRLSHIYGVGVGHGDWGGVLLRFVDQALQDSMIPLDAGAADVRDYLHVRETAACLRSLALSEQPVRGTYNLGFGQSVTLREMAHSIAEAVSRLKGRPVEVRAPQQEETAPGRRAFLDLAKIRQACAFSPAISPNQGIAELVERLVPA